MTNFSRRYKYNPQVPKDPILEDAPSGMRIAYVNGILDHLTYVDSNGDEENSGNKPLEVLHLHSAFCFILREEPSSGRWQYPWKTLTDQVYSVPWYAFFDFVELVGTQLLAIQEFYQSDPKWINRFGYETYRTQVNNLFAEDNIGWRSNTTGQLVREIPPALAKRLELTQTALSDGFEPARAHFAKAMRYANARPADPENSIKETISALESLGRKLYPGTSTLGDVVKEMRKSPTIPAQLVTLIDKFYAFASNQPAVRHGAPDPSTVDLTEAEFCLHVGAALIRYLIDKTK